VKSSECGFGSNNCAGDWRNRSNRFTVLDAVVARDGDPSSLADFKSNKKRSKLKKPALRRLILGGGEIDAGQCLDTKGESYPERRRIAFGSVSLHSIFFW
jgi:hypothetical protein